MVESSVSDGKLDVNDCVKLAPTGVEDETFGDIILVVRLYSEQ